MGKNILLLLKYLLEIYDARQKGRPVRKKSQKKYPRFSSNCMFIFLPKNSQNRDFIRFVRSVFTFFDNFFKFYNKFCKYLKKDLTNPLFWNFWIKIFNIPLLEK